MNLISGLPVKPLVYVKKPKISIEELYGLVSDDEDDNSTTNQPSASNSGRGPSLSNQATMNASQQLPSHQTSANSYQDSITQPSNGNDALYHFKNSF